MMRSEGCPLNLPLTVSEFGDFFREIHGKSPFSWQQDLVERVVEQGAWPDLVDVPTGLGKTSLLDIATFLGAWDADADHRGVGRRRIFLVVDRRIVVDQAAFHARVITKGLDNAEPGSVSEKVALRLRSLGGIPPEDTPLPVVRMRGGVTWDSSWLSRPDLPGVVTGTVDQVGSRALFRGYGVSARRWPIDAALVGTDSLILVDEAHLATALIRTIKSAHNYDQPHTRLNLPVTRVVQLTATGRPVKGWVYTCDSTAHLDDPIAAQRLRAAKSLVLERVAKAKAVKALGDAAVQKAKEPGARVLVVCNTIDRARAVHAHLEKHLTGASEPLLLIGRSRQFDREGIVDSVLELFGADRPTSSPSAVLVATQTVEVGIDLDATSMITESASWDALVQRFGRVNRRGSHSTASITVVHDDDPKAPVYGAARTHAAEYLEFLTGKTGAPVDVSPLALSKLTPPREAISPLPSVPLLLSAHLDAWVRTAPAPVNDAPLDAYLHGLDGGVAPVTLAWRDGLVDVDDADVTQLEANQAIDTIPIRPEECVEVPLSAVRRWLSQEKAQPIADWDDDDDWEIPFGSTEHRLRVLRREFRPDETAQWVWVEPARLRPGDLVVVPSERGGLDKYGWSPTEKNKVLDVAELAALERGCPLLRIDTGLPARLGLADLSPGLWESVHKWQTTDDPESRKFLAKAIVSNIKDWLSNPQGPRPDNPWSREGSAGGPRLERLAAAMTDAILDEASPARRLPTAKEQLYLLPPAVLRPGTTSGTWQGASDDSADGTIHLQKRVALDVHGRAVSNRAEEIARNLRLPDDLRKVIVDAARWHDLGKVDVRFQAMLFNGDPVRAAIASEPLAKSGMPPGDLQQHRDARLRSGLPRGARHEAWSHELVVAHLSRMALPYEGDTELLLHLIASHHGHARPLLPPVHDAAEHSLVAFIGDERVSADLPRTVDFNLAERFQALNHRYGRWGLALLEAVVRCADMTVSGEGS